MGTSFKDLSFFKKVLAVFAIAIGVMLVGFCGIAMLQEVSLFSGSMMASDNAELGVSDSYDGWTGAKSDYSNSYNSSGSDSESSFSTNIIRNFDVKIDTRDIAETVDKLEEVSKSYKAIFDGSSVGDGYGYLTLKIPSDRVEEFVSEVRKDFNVVAYEKDSSNATGNMEDIDSRIEFLESQLDLYQQDLEAAKKEGSIDTSDIRQRMEEINGELWSLRESKKDVKDSIGYSTVYIRIEDSSYTTFHTFDGVGLAIKTSAHAFVLGVIYGLFVIVYGFLMLAVIMWLRNLLVSIKRAFTRKPHNKGNERETELLKEDVQNKTPVSEITEDDAGAVSEESKVE